MKTGRDDPSLLHTCARVRTRTHIHTHTKIKKKKKQLGNQEIQQVIFKNIYAFLALVIHAGSSSRESLPHHRLPLLTLYTQ